MSASPLPTRAADSIVCASPPEHARLLVGSGIGWALDAMDVGLLISDVMTALAAQWGLSNSRLGWIGSIGFVGMMIGVSVGGLLADRLGRRTVFALILLIHGIGDNSTTWETVQSASACSSSCASSWASAWAPSRPSPRPL